ncbi:MAG: MFS transporter [Candidatus Igneacidithiobacillus chanchocoensis]
MAIRSLSKPAGHPLAAAMLGMFLDGFDLSIMAIALLPLARVWQLSPGQTGSIMAMVLIGSFVGALGGGWVSDAFGRRRLLLPNILLYGLGALWSACSPDLLQLEIGRFLTGVAIGLDYPLVATIVAEFSATARRGRGFAWINLSWFVGALASSVLGWALLPLGDTSWRWMLGSAVLPVFLLGWLRRDLPESPRWLWRRGERKRAAAALAALHPDWDAATQEQALRGYTGQSLPLRDLFRGVWRRRLILAILPWSLLDMVSLGIALYLPEVLREQSWVASSQAAAAINAALLVLSALAIAFVLPRLDRWGRIPLQMAGFALMALGLTIFAWAATGDHALVVLLGAALYAIGLGLGPAVTVIALAVELFPTPWRATVSGWATAISRLGAVSSALLFPILQRDLGLAWVLLLTAALAGLAILVSWRYRVESRAQSLEALEIAAR